MDRRRPARHSVVIIFLAYSAIKYLRKARELTKRNKHLELALIGIKEELHKARNSYSPFIGRWVDDVLRGDYNYEWDMR